MLQQTQVARVIPYYLRFLERFPSLRSLAAAGEGEVLAGWSGLGYYARARSLHRAARLALARHGGLPASLEELVALPGFGPYTAGAVASIAFGIPAPAVDGNVARVLSRLFAVEGAGGAGATGRRIWALAGALTGPVKPGDWTQALIELGATLCVKPAPRCRRCPVSTLCEARRSGRERELPAARRRADRTRMRLGFAVIRRRGRLLLRQAPSPGLFAGLWAPPSVELPAGRLGGASARRLLRGGLLDLLGAPVEVGPELATATRTLTHRELELVAFEARTKARLIGPGLRWATPLEAERLGVSSAVRALLARLPARAGRPGG
jgi:A/G-specific adenine glycosylase